MVVNPGQRYSSTSKYIVTIPFYILLNLLFIIIVILCCITYIADTLPFR